MKNWCRTLIQIVVIRNIYASSIWSSKTIDNLGVVHLREQVFNFVREAIAYGFSNRRSIYQDSKQTKKQNNSDRLRVKCYVHCHVKVIQHKVDR